MLILEKYVLQATNFRFLPPIAKLSRMKRQFFLLCAVLLCLINGTQAKQTITVAAAADLKFALDAFNSQFQKAHPDFSVRVIYGASGNLFAQAENGAPFDLFLSADANYPRQLIAHNKADEKSFFLYGIGHLVLWAPKSSKVDVKNGFEALLGPQIKKIAIANPKHAPYGRSAEAALKKAGVYEQIKSKLVRGENVAQATQFVQSGNADAGLIALSLALSPTLKAQGTFWDVPAKLYPRLEQGGIILKEGAQCSGRAIISAGIDEQKRARDFKAVRF